MKFSIYFTSRNSSENIHLVALSQQLGDVTIITKEYEADWDTLQKTTRTEPRLTQCQTALIKFSSQLAACKKLVPDIEKERTKARYFLADLTERNQMEQKWKDNMARKVQELKDNFNVLKEVWNSSASTLSTDKTREFIFLEEELTEITNATIPSPPNEATITLKKDEITLKAAKDKWNAAFTYRSKLGYTSNLGEHFRKLASRTPNLSDGYFNLLHSLRKVHEGIICTEPDEWTSDMQGNYKDERVLHQAFENLISILGTSTNNTAILEAYKKLKDVVKYTSTDRLLAQKHSGPLLVTHLSFAVLGDNEIAKAMEKEAEILTNLKDALQHIFPAPVMLSVPVLAEPQNAAPVTRSSQVKNELTVDSHINHLTQRDEIDLNRPAIISGNLRPTTSDTSLLSNTINKSVTHSGQPLLSVKGVEHFLQDYFKQENDVHISNQNKLNAFIDELIFSINNSTDDKFIIKLALDLTNEKQHPLAKIFFNTLLDGLCSGVGSNNYAKISSLLEVASHPGVDYIKIFKLFNTFKNLEDKTFGECIYLFKELSSSEKLAELSDKIRQEIKSVRIGLISHFIHSHNREFFRTQYIQLLPMLWENEEERRCGDEQNKEQNDIQQARKFFYTPSFDSPAYVDKFIKNRITIFNEEVADALSLPSSDFEIISSTLVKNINSIMKEINARDNAYSSIFKNMLDTLTQQLKNKLNSVLDNKAVSSCEEVLSQFKSLIEVYSSVITNLLELDRSYPKLPELTFIKILKDITEVFSKYLKHNKSPAIQTTFTAIIDLLEVELSKTKYSEENLHLDFQAAKTQANKLIAKCITPASSRLWKLFEKNPTQEPQKTQTISENLVLHRKTVGVKDKVPSDLPYISKRFITYSIDKAPKTRELTLRGEGWSCRFRIETSITIQELNLYFKKMLELKLNIEVGDVIILNNQQPFSDDTILEEIKTDCYNLIIKGDNNNVNELFEIFREDKPQIILKKSIEELVSPPPNLYRPSPSGYIS